MTTGFAIKQAGVINVSTVSATERAAKVNWLVVVGGIVVTDSARDDQIERAWQHLSPRHGAICVAVNVEEIIS